MLYRPYPFKQCSKCHNDFLPTRKFFSPRRDRPDGLAYQCKRCGAQTEHAYRQRHPDTVKAYDHAYKVSHRNIIRERERIYDKAHPGRHKKYTQRYKKRHPEKGRAYSHNRRARQRATGGIHTAADIAEQYKRQNGRCYYCGVFVGDTYDVDHVIPISRGGSNGPSNLVIACPHCNAKKFNRLPHEWPEGGRLL